MPRLRCAPLLLVLGACSHTPTSHAIIDTLPGGVIRVQNPAPSGWADTAHIRFTEIQRIQPPDGSPDELGDIWDMTLAPDGRIFATEVGPLRVVEFDLQGHAVRTLGREGGGPGEYQSAILAFAGGKLFVFDPRQKRSTVFEADGKVQGTYPGTCCMWRRIGTDTLGRVYLPINPRTPDNEVAGHGWVRFSIDGTPVDTIWRRNWGTAQKYWEFSPGPGSRSRYSIPFQPGPVDAPWAGGGLLVGDNGSYSITISPHGTDSSLVFGRAWTPLRIPDSERQARFDRYTTNNDALKAVARLEDVPKTAPAFDELLVDAEQRIWVSLTVPGDSTGTYYDLFSPRGIWLGTARAPFRARAIAFRAGEVVVATTDENDLPMIVRYRIEEPRGDAPARVELGR